MQFPSVRRTSLSLFKGSKHVDTKKMANGDSSLESNAKSSLNYMKCFDIQDLLLFLKGLIVRS